MAEQAEAIKLLKEYEYIIESERPNVGVRKYSHNIITLHLNMIDKLNITGSKANDIIIKYKLYKLGWRVSKEE